MVRPSVIGSSLLAFLCVGLVGSSARADGLVISELRLRGPNGMNDEFVEIYNDSDQPHVVKASSGNGYGLAASDGETRFTIPNGTVIPARGHFLGVNSMGYSLASYPAATGKTANGDASWTKDIVDNKGVALFDNDTGGASYVLARRLDAVGSASEANALYRKGNGLPPLTPFSIDHSWVRKFPGTGAIVPTTCLAAMTGAAPQNTGENANDFYFVDTNGTSAGGGQRLGAPGPQNAFSPVQSLAPSATSMKPLDLTETMSSPPNLVRDFASDPPNNSTFGTLDVRRTFKNESDVPITRLRFRVIALSTFPAPSETADLRPRSSSNIGVLRSKPGGGNEIALVRGTTLETAPSQPNGGGFNSSLSVNTINAMNPLAPGASVDVRFLLGLQQTGKYQFFVEVEALPSATRTIWGMTGDTENAAANVDCAVINSKTELATSAVTLNAGEEVTFTATSAVDQDAAAGDVQFFDGDVELGHALITSGKATFSTSALAVGPHSITAKYLGSGAIVPSKSQSIAIEVEAAWDANATGEAAPPSSNGANGANGGGEPTSSATGREPIGDDGSAPSVESGCNAGRRADAPSVAMIGVLLAAVLVASRRRRML